MVLQGIEMGYSPCPVHKIYIESKLVSGVFPVAVCSELPIKGVTLLIGNDVAGGKVTPVLEVWDSPQSAELNTCDSDLSLFPSCAITRAQARTMNNISLSDSLLMSVFSDDKAGDAKMETSPEKTSPEARVSVRSARVKPFTDATLSVSSERLTAAQRADPTLKHCFERVVSADKASVELVAYLLNKEILVRKWTPPGPNSEYGCVYQVVVPSIFRRSGHLGVNKTYKLILKYFFWPSLKSDVAEFCRSCHVCQMVGKPN